MEKKDVKETMASRKNLVQIKKQINGLTDKNVSGIGKRAAIMIVQILFAFAIFVPALSCSGGVGDYIIQNPTFAFDFNPPVSWTWFQPNGTAGVTYYPSQVTSQADAMRNMKNNIDGAVLNAAQKLGYSTIGMTWTITGYNPQSMYVIDDSQIAALTTAPPGAFVGSYAPGLGAVLSKRGTFEPTSKTYAVVDYFEHLTINVRGSGLYTKSQWQTFADQVFNYLTIYEKVRFRGPVTIN